ncbi:ProQ/FINO family protein, partial [Psittacicella hinzii]
MSEERKAFTPRVKSQSRPSNGSSTGRKFSGYRPVSVGGKAGFNGKPSRGPVRGGRTGDKKPFGRRPLSPQERKVQLEKQQKRERIEQTYEALHAKFPQAFDRNNIKPLAVDVHKELFAIATEEGPLRKSLIRHFLARYIRNEAYHEAALKHQKRFNLQGEAVVDLTAEELEYHRSNIKPKPQFTRKPGFGGKKPGFGGRRPSAPNRGGRPQSGFRRPAFAVGQKVLAGDKRTGVVKEIIGDKARVTLDNNIT